MERELITSYQVAFVKWVVGEFSGCTNSPTRSPVRLALRYVGDVDVQVDQNAFVLVAEGLSPRSGSK